MRGLGLGLRFGRGRGGAGFPSSVLAKVANRWDAHRSDRYSDAAHTTYIPAGDQVLGAWKDLVAGAYLTQSTTSLKPTVTRSIQGFRDVVRFDNVDDILSVASGISAAGGLWFGSRYGVQYAPGPITSDLNCPPLYDLGAVISLNSALTTGEKASLQAWATANGFGNERFLVGSTTDTTIYHTTSPGITWYFVGANGVTYSSSTNETTDLSAQGLTAPITVYVPSGVSPTVGQIKFNGNGLAGAMPDLTGITGLQSFYCHQNKYCGSVPSLTGLVNLTDLRFDTNKLTGSLPSFDDLVSVVYLYFYANQLSGTVPSLANMTSAYEIRGNGNKFTDYAGGGISSTVGRLYMHNNLFVQSAIDGFLSDLVDGGRTSGDGVCDAQLDGTGNATPSAAGLADKATLISRGWTVATN